MGENSKISWTDHTFNPWRGCSKIAPGCQNCYAAREAKRFPKNRGIWGDSGTRVKAADSMWAQPKKWNDAAAKAGCRARVFCASLADVFEDWQGPIMDHNGGRLFVTYESNEITSAADPNVLPKYLGRCWLTMDEMRTRLFRMIDATPDLDWLLLTKRPENVHRMWRYDNHPPSCPVERQHGDIFASAAAHYRHNVWLGASVSEQETADRNIPELLKCRDIVPVLFVSYEPALEPVDLTDYVPVNPDDFPAEWDMAPRSGIDQIIIGVESNGPRVGRLGEFKNEKAWIESAIQVVAQCREAGVAVFVKQVPLGGMVSHDPACWPAELQIREFPTPRVPGKVGSNV